MQARTEGHAGIKRQDNLVRLGRILAPRGTNDHALAYMRDVKEFFPGIGPIFFVDRARLQFAYKMRANTREVPQSFLDALPCLLLFAINGYIGAHMHGLSDKDTVLLTLID
jgi:hypothetical protein